jgi:hypothetical protein
VLLCQRFSVLTPLLIDPSKLSLSSKVIKECFICSVTLFDKSSYFLCFFYFAHIGKPVFKPSASVKM